MACIMNALSVSKRGICSNALDKFYALFHLLIAKQNDKVGSYRMQSSDNILLNRMIGCYYNIIGLPINVVAELLSKIQVNLCYYLKKS